MTATTSTPADAVHQPDGLISSTIVHPGGFASGRLEAGQRLRIVDLHGKQVSDLILYSTEVQGEVSDMITTCLEQDSWRLSTGAAIYSTHVRPMARITRDTVGVHGFTGGACSGPINRAAGVDQPGCQDAIAAGWAALGRPDLGTPTMAALNVFQPPLTQPDGSFHPHEPVSGPGDFLELTAEIPLFWAMSCCPYPGPINGHGPTDMEAQVLGPVA